MLNEQLLTLQAAWIARRLRISVQHARLLAELALTSGRPA